MGDCLAAWHFSRSLTVIFLFSFVLLTSPGYAEDAYADYLHRAIGSFDGTVSSTSAFTGGFSYEYPIALPVGAGSLEPQVSLTYSSLSVKGLPSVVGPGWSLTQPMVIRDTNGTRASKVDDRYFLTLNNRREELVYNSTEKRWYTKQETFWYVNNTTATGNTYGVKWQVVDQDGTEYSFGATSTSELTSNLENYTVAWYVDKINDTNGNEITYNYSENPFTKDTGVTYLVAIEYSNKTRRVLFDYESNVRGDLRTTYANGIKTNQSRRLANISVYAASSLASKYKLEYALVGTQGVLRNITRLGSDGTSALPPDKFEYYYDIGWGADAGDIPCTPAGAIDYGTRLVDINGDGVTDCLEAYSGGGSSFTTKAYLNSPTLNWTQNNSWNVSIDMYFASSAGDDAGVRLTDINSDGLSDIVRYEWDSGSGTPRTDINNGLGWTTNSTWNAPNPLTQAGVGTGSSFIDMNGDGRVDEIYSEYSGSLAVEDFLNNGAGFTADTGTWESTQTFFFLNSAGEDTGARFADLNGDGLTDVLAKESGGGTGEVWYNTGAGWEEQTSAHVTGMFTYVGSTGRDNGARIGDVDGDGLDDQMYGSLYSGSLGTEATLNNGSGWVSNSSWEPIVAFMTSGGVNRGTWLADINGDGALDLGEHYAVGHGNINAIYLNKGAKNFLMKNVTSSAGTVTSIYYNASTTYNNSGSDGKPDMSIPLMVVSSIVKAHASNQPLVAKNFSYWGGRYFVAPPLSEFRGFAKVRETNGDGSYVDHSFHQDLEKNGQEFLTEVFERNGTLIQNTSRYFKVTNRTAYTVQLQDQNVTLPGSQSITYSQYNYYDTYGNVANVTQRGDTGISTDDMYLRTTYVTNSTVRITNLPAQTTTYASDNSTIVRRSNYTYDTRGNLLSEDRYISPNPGIKTQYTYDTYGNPITTIDPRGNTQTMTYDSAGVFLLSTKNALNHTSNKTWDARYGLPLTETEANGYSTSSTYDTFGRITTQYSPYDTASSATTAYQYTYDGVPPEAVTITKKVNVTTNATTIRYVNGIGELLQTKNTAESSLYAVQDYGYDLNGRLNMTTNPYYSANNSYSLPILTGGYVGITFDALDRPLQTRNADATTQNTSYNKNASVHYNENGKRIDTIKDAYGNIIRIVEYISGTPYTTTYTYDAANQLKTITDAVGNVITFNYDTLGRKISLIDPNLGTWNYTYDANGNLVTQRDNRGTTVSLTYDALNRVTGKSGTTNSINYTYDTQTKGTLAKVTLATTANKTYGYDQRLRIIQENLTIDGVTYNTNYTYDSANNIIRKTLPNGTTIVYTYNIENKPETITNAITDIDYAASGNPTGRAYSNGLTTNLTYKTDNQRLSRIYTGTKQDINFTYDPTGNILTIGDPANSASETYTYDDLNRISTANRIVNGTTVFSATYTISPINVITSIVTNSWTKTFSFGSTPTHAPSGVTE